MPKAGDWTSVRRDTVSHRQSAWRRQRMCTTPLGRFMAKVHVADNGCWEWVGARSTDGYGHVSLAGSVRPAHRIAYEWVNGPIPNEMQMDHLCRNPPCVNPSHLEPVAQRENILRGMDPVRAANLRSGRCGNGHIRTPETVHMEGNSHRCLVCAATVDRRRAPKRSRGGHPAHDPQRREVWIASIRASKVPA